MVGLIPGLAQPLCIRSQTNAAQEVYKGTLANPYKGHLALTKHPLAWEAWGGVVEMPPTGVGCTVGRRNPSRVKKKKKKTCWLLLALHGNKKTAAIGRGAGRVG